jgi:hypothetical protein
MAIRTRSRDRDADLRDDVVEERVRATGHETTNTVARVIASLVAAVPVVIGLVALIRLDWTDGFSSPPVDVLGMPFTPAVAIVTLVLGLFALGAAAGADRASKIAVGAVLGCVGLAILLAGSARADYDLATGHGWLALVVGAVLLLAGLTIRHAWGTSREVRGRQAATGV